MNVRKVPGPTAIVGITALVLALATLIGLPTPFQTVAALIVLIALPGYSLSRLMPDTDPAVGLLVALALGLATLTAVSTTMFYLTVWSWRACVLTMAAITVLACLARVRQEAAA